MAFQQLYYTSCEHGLAGYSGYQFNAITPGVSPVVMREVEDRTVYEPPGWLLAAPRPEDPEHPDRAPPEHVVEALRRGLALVLRLVARFLLDALLPRRLGLAFDTPKERVGGPTRPLPA